MFIHQRTDWPQFHWDEPLISPLLARVRHVQGYLMGRMAALGFDLQTEARLTTLTADVLKSSEIEGERLDPEQVRSSLARRMGLDVAGMIPADRNVEGVVEMMLDATEQYAAPLSAERLLGWHAALFPGGYSGMYKILIGQWRDDRTGPMQIVSGPLGREKVHFEAPSAERLESEMTAFLVWLEADQGMDKVLKAGLAHFWFVTIHPFEDGNGRMARAIGDLMLARSENSAYRFYSLSAQIQKERAAYYQQLEDSQKGDLDITDWLRWFLECLERAIEAAQEMLESVLFKARFWETHRDTVLSERQRKMLNRLLDGFTGKLTSSKWAKICKCSQDTAHRDIMDLIDKQILRKEEGGGRSSAYTLN